MLIQESHVDVKTSVNGEDGDMSTFPPCSYQVSSQRVRYRIMSVN